MCKIPRKCSFTNTILSYPTPLIRSHFAPAKSPLRWSVDLCAHRMIAERSWPKFRVTLCAGTWSYYFGLVYPQLCYLQDTCRTAAPELRHGPEAQRTWVQKQTHLLCPFTFQFGLVFAITESLSSIFHLDTTQWEKKYFLISLLHRHLTSFSECPQVLPVASIWNISVNGMAEKPWAILKTSIKSARFRRSSNVHSPSFCNLASYCNDLIILVIIRVNLCCTFSWSFLSFW